MVAVERDADFPLDHLPTRGTERRLVRCVPALSFLSRATPRFLFTSGRPNRFNPPGTDCLYFSETESIANLEWEAQLAGTPLADQPKLVFFARVKLRRILDLADPATLRALRFDDADLFGPWRTAETPTRPQRLGLAIARQTAITAIRYPSAAARAAGPSGYNLAIFPSTVREPDRVEILGRDGESVETLPSRRRD